MTKKNKMPSYFLLAVVIFLQIILPQVAHAGVVLPSGPGVCGGNTIGAAICNVIQNTWASHALLTALSYLFGLFIGVWAIAKMYYHVINPNQTSIWESLQRALVAGALFALPTIIEAAYITLTAGNNTGLVVNNWAGATTGTGLDAMVVALMNDSFQWTGQLLMFFCYMAGGILTIIGILRLMKSSQEGARGPGGFGTIMTFLVAGALFSADELMAAASNTFFGTNDVAVTAALNFSSGLTAAEQNHVLAVISGVLAFVMILGWISFIRGFFIIRGVAEGNQQASIMSGMTHILGGSLAINLGPLLNMVQNTFGLGTIGVSFS